MSRPLRLLVTAILLIAGCTEAPSGRVIVLGIDGVDPAAVELLASEGKLPFFARLQREGAWGELASMDPMLSPILWTTMATGKRPEDHGILDFVATDSATGKQLPVTSRMRRLKALWNIASEHGRTVAVVGWWATWPPEAVNGWMVSDHTCYHFLFTEAAGSNEVLTHPPELAAEITPLVRRPADVGYAEASTYLQVSESELDRPFDFEDPSSQLRWALATADSYRGIGLHLWRSRRPDLLMVYIEAVDTTSHLFGHLFRTEGLVGELGEQQQRYGHAVEEMYRYADRMVGEVLAAMDEEDTLLIASDHGFSLGQLHPDPRVTTDMRRISARFHRRQGIVAAYGRGVRPGSRFTSATVLDIAPTVLALCGLPAARDMPGRVLSEALEIAIPARTVDSYESGEPSRHSDPTTSEVDQAIVDRLRSLGYVGSEEASGRSARTRAALLFEAERFVEAADAYAKLLEESPDDSDLHVGLAGCLGALGRYAEALDHLARALEIDPLCAEAYHNRAVILERVGNLSNAIEQYRTALKYDPDYEPSQRALQRLVGSAAPQVGSAEERSAIELADRAADAAQRGDYDTACRLLDQASSIAPRLALIPHYRSNVAYLRGDLEGAAAALERAIELDPDNALYRVNLERLRREIARSPD